MKSEQDLAAEDANVELSKNIGTHRLLSFDTVAGKPSCLDGDGDENVLQPTETVSLTEIDGNLTS